MTIEPFHALNMTELVKRADTLENALSFWKREQLIVLPELLPPAAVAELLEDVSACQHRLVRKRVFGYKNSGSISYRALLEAGRGVNALYNSRPLVDFFSRLADLPLITCGEEDPHACAVYQYEAPGDHVGFHYDTSWYAGARFTVLVGLVHAPSVRLHCRPHSRDPHRPTEDLEVAITPGTVVFFNGDKLEHRVTPLAAGERRVVLTMQYVTSRRMHPVKRAISNLKDALTYFGMDALRPQRPLLPSPEGQRAEDRARQSSSARSRSAG